MSRRPNSNQSKAPKTLRDLFENPEFRALLQEAQEQMQQEPIMRSFSHDTVTSSQDIGIAPETPPQPQPIETQQFESQIGSQMARFTEQVKKIKESNPHEWLYLLSLANELRRLGFNFTKHATGIDINQWLMRILFFSPIIAAATKGSPQLQQQIIQPLQRLPMVLYTAARNAAKYVMPLDEFPDDVGLAGNILSAIYFWMMSGRVVEGANLNIASVFEFNSNLPSLFQNSEMLSLQNSPMAMMFVQSIMALITLRTSGQISRELSSTFQEIYNQAHSPFNPIQIALTAKQIQQTVSQDPYRALYNSTLALIALQQTNQWLGAGLGVNPSTLAQMILSFGPLLPSELIHRIMPEDIQGYLPSSSDLTDLVHSSAEQFSQSPLALSPQETISTQRTVIQSGAFLVMNYYHREMLISLSRWTAYLAFHAGLAYLPDGMAEAAYQYFSLAALQTTSEMSLLTANTVRFLISIGAAKIIGEIAQGLPDYYETITEFATPYLRDAQTLAIPSAQNAAKKARDLYNLPPKLLLLWEAHQNPYDNYKLGQYYQQQGKPEKAIAAYNKVPIPSEEDLAMLNERDLIPGEKIEIDAIYSNVLDNLFDQYKKIGYGRNDEELEELLGREIHTYILAQREIAFRKLAQARDKLKSGITAGVHQLLQESHPKINQLGQYAFRIVEWHVANAEYQQKTNHADASKSLLELLFSFHVEHHGITRLEQNGNKTDYYHLVSISIGDHSYEHLELPSGSNTPNKVMEDIYFIMLKNILGPTLEPPVSSNMTWDTLKESAMKAKKNNNPLMAFIYYRLAARAFDPKKIRTNPGKAESVFSPTPPPPIDEENNYYRCLHNCGAMALEIAETVDDPSLKQKILEAALEFFQHATEAGLVTCSDKSKIPLSKAAKQQAKATAVLLDDPATHKATLSM